MTKRRILTSEKVQSKTTSATPAKKLKVNNDTATNIATNQEDATNKVGPRTRAGAKVKSTTTITTTNNSDNSKNSKVAEKTSKDQQPASASSQINDDGTRISVWLMKSEPDTFSIDDLINSKDSTSHWEGVRNHEAKNLMKNSMKVGDRVLFYHSNTKTPGIVALAKVAKESYPDHTAFDPKSNYYDSKSSKDDPRWFMVDVKFDRKLKRVLTLKELQQYKDKELKQMKLLNRGRLSVQPVSDSEMEFIMALEQRDGPSEE